MTYSLKSLAIDPHWHKAWRMCQRMASPHHLVDRLVPERDSILIEFKYTEPYIYNRLMSKPLLCAR